MQFNLCYCCWCTCCGLAFFLHLHISIFHKNCLHTITVAEFFVSHFLRFILQCKCFPGSFCFVFVFFFIHFSFGSLKPELECELHQIKNETYTHTYTYTYSSDTQKCFETMHAMQWKHYVKDVLNALCYGKYSMHTDNIKNATNNTFPYTVWKKWLCAYNFRNGENRN